MSVHVHVVDGSFSSTVTYLFKFPFPIIQGFLTLNLLPRFDRFNSSDIIARFVSKVVQEIVRTGKHATEGHMFTYTIAYMHVVKWRAIRLCIYLCNAITKFQYFSSSFSV